MRMVLWYNECSRTGWESQPATSIVMGIMLCQWKPYLMYVYAYVKTKAASKAKHLICIFGCDVAFFSCHLRESIFFIPLSIFFAALFRSLCECFFVLLVITAHCHVNQRVCICENRVPFNWSSWKKKMEILTVLWRYHCLEILRDEFSIEKNRLWFLGMRCDLNLSSWFFCAMIRMEFFLSIYLKLAMKFTFFGYLPKRMDTLAKSKKTFRNCWQRQNRAFQFDICPKIMFFLLLVKNVIRNETIKVDGWTERSRDKEREKIQWAIVEHFKTKCT